MNGDRPRLARPYLVRTPESVVFAYEEAGVYTRYLAWSVDALLMGLVLVAGGTLLALVAGITPGLASPLVYVFFFSVSTGYFVFCEWRMAGSSPGKRLFRLRVVRDDGLRIGIAPSVIRNLLRAVDSLPGLYGVALAVAALSRESRRLGDHVARTIVVAERRRDRPRGLDPDTGTALARDPGFRELARRRIGAEARDVALSALLRRDELRVEARARIFAALARHLEARLGLAKPEHLSDERFVAEVAAAVLG